MPYQPGQRAISSGVPCYEESIALSWKKVKMPTIHCKPPVKGKQTVSAILSQSSAEKRFKPSLLRCNGLIQRKQRADCSGLMGPQPPSRSSGAAPWANQLQITFAKAFLTPFLDTALKPAQSQCQGMLLSRTFLHANVCELLLHTCSATLTLVLINSDIFLGNFPLPVWPCLVLFNLSV